jgi:catalase
MEIHQKSRNELVTTTLGYISKSLQISIQVGLSFPHLLQEIHINKASNTANNK